MKLLLFLYLAGISCKNKKDLCGAKLVYIFPPFFRGVFQISITKSLSLLVSTLCNSRFPRYRITILIMHTILWVKSKWCRREIESRHWNCKGSFKYDRVTAHRHHYVFVLCVRKSVLYDTEI